MASVWVLCCVLVWWGSTEREQMWMRAWIPFSSYDTILSIPIIPCPWPSLTSYIPTSQSCKNKKLKTVTRTVALAHTSQLPRKAKSFLVALKTVLLHCWSREYIGLVVDGTGSPFPHPWTLLLAHSTLLPAPVSRKLTPEVKINLNRGAPGSDKRSLNFIKKLVKIARNRDRPVCSLRTQEVGAGGAQWGLHSEHVSRSRLRNIYFRRRVTSKHQEAHLLYRQQCVIDNGVLPPSWETERASGNQLHFFLFLLCFIFISFVSFCFVFP